MYINSFDNLKIENKHSIYLATAHTELKSPSQINKLACTIVTHSFQAIFHMQKERVGTLFYEKYLVIGYT